MSEAPRKPTGKKKDAYWFKHDSNARHDPKIQSLRSVHGEKGYGWFWIIVEILREQIGYKFPIAGKYSYTVLSRELGASEEEARAFIEQCIKEFGLFKADKRFIWSDSLNERMFDLDQRRQVNSENARKGQQKRREGEQKPPDSDEMRLQSDRTAVAVQTEESRSGESRTDQITAQENTGDQTIREVRKGNMRAEAQAMVTAYLGVPSIWADDNREGDSGEAFLDDSLFYVSHEVKDSLLQAYRIGGEQDLTERFWELHDKFDAEDYDTLPQWLKEQFQRRVGR